MKIPVTARILLACIIAGVFPLAAWAHAFLDHAQPKVGASVDAAPAEVKIWFTEEIEPDFSTIQVLDSTGKQVDKKDFHRDAADKKLGIISLPALPAGTYKVVWQVVSTDTHKTNGDFTFTAKSPSLPPATAPSSSPVSQPSTSDR